MTPSDPPPNQGVDGHGEVGGGRWGGAVEASAGQVVQDDIGVRSVRVRVAAALILIHPGRTSFVEAVKGKPRVTEVVTSQ